MTKYRVQGIATFSVWTDVEADSEEEARAEANGRGMAGLSHNALYPDPDEAWHTELDGEPRIESVEEVGKP